MPINIKAGIYVLVAIACAYLFLSVFYKGQRKVVTRIALGWALLSAVAFSAPGHAVYFIVTGSVLYYLTPKKNVSDAIQFYVAMLPVVPSSIVWEISAPGVQKVIELNYLIFLSWILLVPLYFNVLSNKTLFYKRFPNIGTVNTAYKLLVFFLFIALIQDWRGYNLTTGIRNSLEEIFGLIFVLIVFFKSCDSRETIDKVLFGMMISGVFIAAVASVEAVTGWKIYNSIDTALIGEGSAMSNVKQFRNGFLRPTATMLPIALGFYLSISIILGYYFYQLKRVGYKEFGGSILVCLPMALALFFTGSRGAWMIVCVMFFMTIILKSSNRGLRLVLICSAVVTLVFSDTLLNQFIALDTHGTFQYRLDLIGNSWIAIQDNFFLGNNFFRQHPAMLASEQGQGIVDVVNVYLAIALDYGVPMAILFVFIIFKVSLQLTGSRKFNLKAPGVDLAEQQSRFLHAIILGSVVMIATVSFVDRIQHYFLINLVLGMCIFRYTLISYRNNVDKSDPNQPTPDAEPDTKLKIGYKLRQPRTTKVIK